MPKQKVLLALSGGVDSSVSAVLLLEQGYEVIGGFMKNWSGEPLPLYKGEVGRGSESAEFKECGWKKERRDAMRVASQLGIPFVTFDFEKEYRRDVIEYLFRECEAGRTPNPDVMCNRYIKFDLFLKETDRLGCDFMATGHYARVNREQGTGNREQMKIRKGIDANKDQTYFLWAIEKDVLSRVLFPIGHLLKPEVRAIARMHKLVVAEKKDSTGICFVGEVDMPEFLNVRMKEHPGNVVTSEGKIVGTHMGVNFYTMGQRHGLKIGGGDPYYVVEKRAETNELVVGSNFHPALYRKELTASSLNWFCEPILTIQCEARIRHRQAVQTCTVSFCHSAQREASCVRVFFDLPQRAITPGQSIVFYDGDEMLGGGIIDDF